METWTKYTYTCEPNECDAMIEFTCKDDFGFPSGSIHNIKCPCGRTPVMVSQEDATIRPTNEKEQQMETKQYTALSDGYQVEALEFRTNGETVTHYLTKADINEMFRKKQYLESFLETANKKISQITDNLTVESWYSETVDKAEVLRDLCTILEHEAKATLNWVALVRVEGSTDVPIEEIEDFDLTYLLNDELCVDMYHGDTVINSHYVDDVESQEWE